MTKVHCKFCTRTQSTACSPWTAHFNKGGWKKKLVVLCGVSTFRVSLQRIVPQACEKCRYARKKSKIICCTVKCKNANTVYRSVLANFRHWPKALFYIIKMSMRSPLSHPITSSPYLFGLNSGMFARLGWFVNTAVKAVCQTVWSHQTNTICAP